MKIKMKLASVVCSAVMHASEMMLCSVMPTSMQTSAKGITSVALINVLLFSSAIIIRGNTVMEDEGSVSAFTPSFPFHEPFGRISTRNIELPSIKLLASSPSAPGCGHFLNSHYMLPSSLSIGAFPTCSLLYSSPLKSKRLEMIDKNNGGEQHPPLDGKAKSTERNGYEETTAGDEVAERLLRRAAELRGRVTALEMELEKNVTNPKNKTDRPQEEGKRRGPSLYRTIEGSMWKLTFRVIKCKKDDVSEKRKTATQTMNTQPATGAVFLKFRADGYTDMITTIGTETTDKERIEPSLFSKFWGWDIERAEKGEKQGGNEGDDESMYLLFSADTSETPSSSKDLWNRAGVLDESQPTTRLYFQARLDNGTDKTGGIALKDGKVTIKQNIQGSFWGVFNAAGILAEFLDVGDFVCRPL